MDLSKVAAMTRIDWLKVMAPLAASGVLVACGHAPAPAVEVTPVVALPVRAQGDLQAMARLPVEIAARYSNAMSFRIPGKIVDRAVRLGDAVRAGQVVARLDDADARAQDASARAALAAAEHRLTYSRQQLDRDQAQSAQNLIAPAQLEQTQDQYAAALATRDQARAQAELAHNNLAYAALVADHDGVIASEDADTGQVVAAGQAVFGVAQSGEVDAVLDAPQGVLAGLAAGRPAVVRLPALPGVSLPARVREIAGVADPQSRTWRVRLTLPAPPAGVRLGMTGEAEFNGPGAPGGGQDGRVFVLPATALFHQGVAPAVWVIRAADATLELRPVTVGRFDERSVVVTGGLADGEAVVQAGVNTVHAGQHVRAVAPLYSDDAATGDGK